MENSDSTMDVSSPENIDLVSARQCRKMRTSHSRHNAHSPHQFQLGGTYEPKLKRRKIAFKIWEDPISDKEKERNRHTVYGRSTHPATTSFTPINSKVLPMDNVNSLRPTRSTSWTTVNRPIQTTSKKTLVSEAYSTLSYHGMDLTVRNPLNRTFSMSEAEKYPNARAGIPTGPKREYEYKPGITFPAPPMEDLGLISTTSITDKKVYRQLDKDPAITTKGKRPTALKLPPVFSPKALYDTSPKYPTPNFTRWLQVHSASPTSGFSPTRTTTLSVETPQVLYRSATTSRLNRRILTSPIITPTARRAVSFSSSELTTPLVDLNKTRGKSGVSVDPVCAKPCPNSNKTPPPEPPLLPPQQRFPGAAQIICSCHKPAETFKVKIVECYNSECIVGWHHYACLGKNHKLSALHGKWTCDLCRAEKHWGVATVDTDMKSVFSASEMVEALGGPGGIGHVTNPYGMQNPTEVYGGIKPRAAHNLGWAIFEPEAVQRAFEKAEYDSLTRLQEYGNDLASDYEPQDYGITFTSGSERQEYLGEFTMGFTELDFGSEELGESSEELDTSSGDISLELE
jgi:hypothetical protein